MQEAHRASLWTRAGAEEGGRWEGSGEAPTLEVIQVQIDGFFSQLSDKCHQNRVASVGD